jgi:O-antigen ligase
VKWIVFLASAAAMLPLAAWLRQNKVARKYAVVLLVALPFIVGVFPKFQIALSGDPEWPGYVIGFDVSILDLWAGALYLSIPGRLGFIPFKSAFLLYILAVALSVANSHFTSPSLWYLWQCLRMFFFFAVLVRVCREESGSQAVINGLVVGICFEAALVLWQRFVIHNPHAPGSFFHQNALGFALHFAVIPVFALALNDRQNWKYLFVTFLGLVCDVFTASRASLGLIVAGLGILLIISTLRNWTAKKARIVALAALCALVLTPIAIRTFEIRASAFGIETDDGRTEMNNGARMMAASYPFGVGANNFVLVAQREGFYWAAGVRYPNYNISPHNAYWTTLAETGYFGLFSLLFWIALPLVVAISCGWRNRRDPRGDILLGLGISLFVVAIHSEYEWLLLSGAIQYVLVTSMALIAGLSYQLGYWSVKSSVGDRQKKTQLWGADREPTYSR